jgi:pimeloyl-ACP methyl ester carboxylesterase
MVVNVVIMHYAPMNTDPTETSPKRRPRALRFLFRIVLVSVCIAIGVGITAWLRPFWVLQKITEFQLLRAGIHSRSMILDGVRVHYLEGGSGKPIVLIHGLGSQAWQDWDDLAPQLVRAGYHVYALDLLGFGNSAKPDVAYSIPLEAQFVEGFMNAKHLESVDVIGNSMGGWIALTVALERPPLVARLILLDSVGMTFRFSFDPMIFTPETRAQVDQLIAGLTGESSEAPNLLKDDVIRRARNDGWVVKRVLASMTEGRDFLDTRLSSIKIPTLIIWGKQDTLVPPALGLSMHTEISQSTMVIYDQCGHIALQMCSDRVTPTVLSFLRGQGPAPGTTTEVAAKP